MLDFISDSVFALDFKSDSAAELYFISFSSLPDYNSEPKTFFIADDLGCSKNYL